jgi:hypothetical protein
MRWYRKAKSISYMESLHGEWPEGTVRSKYGGEQQVLTRIPLDAIGVTPGNVMYEGRIGEYVKNPPPGYPEVIRGGEGLVTEDGNHRMEAARRRGEQDILAWLGDRPPWEGGDPVERYDPDDDEAMEKNKQRQSKGDGTLKNEGQNWELKNMRRAALIRLKVDSDLTSTEENELRILQAEACRRTKDKHALPFLTL